MNFEEDELVLSEKSLFRTRIPRSTNMTLHLVVWAVTLCGSLLVTMLSAQYFRRSEHFLGNSVAVERAPSSVERE